MRRKSLVEHVCEYCDKAFLVKPCRLKNGRKYCSIACRHAAQIRPMDVRFWEKVDKSGECWLWTANPGPRGYGLFSRDGEMVIASRVAYELANGPIPEGMEVCHHCDNPSCMRPDHLFLGTHSDNMQDMVRKGRKARNDGENNNNARLTWAQVQNIRERYACDDVTRADLAREYGVSWPTINAIVKHKKWVEPTPEALIHMEIDALRAIEEWEQSLPEVRVVAWSGDDVPF